MEVAMFWNGFPVAVLLLGVPMPMYDQGTRLAKLTEQAAVAQFTDAVNRYMNLRWMVEEPLEPRVAHAHRNHADDIFSPAVASLFRQHITAARYELGAEVVTYLEDAELQNLIEWPRLEVNGSLQWNTGEVLWLFLLRRLPSLPPELEYRFVGRDLVLVDVDLNLVVDILENVDDAS